MCWMSPSVSWGMNCASFALESCSTMTIPPRANHTRNDNTETTAGNLNASRPSFPASFSPDRASRIINSDPEGRHGSDLWWKWGFSIWQLKRCDKRLSHGSERRSERERISCWLHSQKLLCLSSARKRPLDVSALTNESASFRGIFCTAGSHTDDLFAQMCFWLWQV